MNEELVLVIRGRKHVLPATPDPIETIWRETGEGVKGSPRIKRSVIKQDTNARSINTSTVRPKRTRHRLKKGPLKR